ncbi:MAG: PD-(D/E)XK nuclease family protein [Candidatus Peribacteraceae bacterium]|nr:PD-(D/E)XK nuclease family protein [Candidatus Peribacteraceae bacterium]
MAKKVKKGSIYLQPKMTEAELELFGDFKMVYPERCRDDTDDGHLSASSVGMYCRCPFQFFKRYVEGKKQPPGVAMEEGKSHHVALEGNNRHKIKKGRDRKAKENVEQFCDDWSDRQKGIPKKQWQFSNDTPKSIVTRGTIIQTKYAKEIAPLFKPKWVEKEVRIDIGPVHMLGYIDVYGSLKLDQFGFLSKNGNYKPTVMDYKTAARAKSVKELENSIQLGTYGMAVIKEVSGLSLKKNPPQVGFGVLKKTKEPQVEVQITQMNLNRLLWYRRIVLSVAKAISAGIFPLCNPCENNLCNERFCGFWHECRGAIWPK